MGYKAWINWLPYFSLLIDPEMRCFDSLPSGLQNLTRKQNQEQRHEMHKKEGLEVFILESLLVIW